MVFFEWCFLSSAGAATFVIEFEEGAISGLPEDEPPLILAQPRCVDIDSYIYPYMCACKV